MCIRGDVQMAERWKWDLGKGHMNNSTVIATPLAASVAVAGIGYAVPTTMGAADMTRHLASRSSERDAIAAAIRGEQHPALGSAINFYNAPEPRASNGAFLRAAAGGDATAAKACQSLLDGHNGLIETVTAERNGLRSKGRIGMGVAAGAAAIWGATALLG